MVQTEVVANIFHSPGIEHNFEMISKTTTIKGYLKESSTQDGLSNKTVNIYVEDIKVGQTRTTKTGCFFFNDWNNKAIRSILDNPINPVQVIDIKVRYAGDHPYLGSSTTLKDTIFFSVPLMGRPSDASLISNDNSSGLDLDLRSGTSYHLLRLSNLRGNVITSETDISFNALPCGINGTITHIGNVQTKEDPLYLVKLQTTEKLEPRQYKIGISGKGAIEDKKTGAKSRHFVISQEIPLKLASYDFP